MGKILIDDNHRFTVASNRRIYDVLEFDSTPIYTNNYTARSLWTVGKTFLPAALNNTLVRFSLTDPAFKLTTSGGTLNNPYSFMFTDFLNNPLLFEIAQHDPTTGFIAGSFLANLSNTANNLGYVYFNNPDVITSQENRTDHNANAIASWHLPNRLNFKPGVADSDFNLDFNATTGLRGAAANFTDVVGDIRTVRSSLLNGLSAYTIETMVYFNELSSLHQLLTIPSTDTGVGTEFNIRTHNSPESTVPIDGIKLRIVGAGGTSEYFYRSIDLVANRWYHLVATFNSNGIQQLFVDGELITATSNTSVAQGVSTYTGASLSIGGYGANLDFHNGRLDDILILSSTLSANSALWRARNCLYPDSSFVLAAMETPGVSNDIAEGIYFDILNNQVFDININNHVFSSAGRTATITSVTQPPAGEGAVSIQSSTQARYTPATSFSGTPDFTINVSTA